jgi:hypothetical protein
LRDQEADALRPNLREPAALRVEVLAATAAMKVRLHTHHVPFASAAAAIEELAAAT